MGHTITQTETLNVLRCAECSMMFAITAHFERERRDDRSIFYCPRGHSQWFPGETLEKENQRLKARLRANKDQLEAAHRETAAYKGVATKRKNQLDRVAAGVCPECHRSFQNLRRHMEGQHGKD